MTPRNSGTQQFSAKIGAAALIGLGLLYMILALATGHSAVAEAPPDLSASTAGLDVWHGLALMVQHGDQLVVIDNRPQQSYELFHLPDSIHLPGANASELADAVGERTHAILVAADDGTAASLVGELKQLDPATGFHFLNGGVQSWYLALELPVPLFSEKAPPYGYTEALSQVKRWLAEADQTKNSQVQTAIEKLVTIGYQPTQLATGQKPPTSGTRKKISGGCG